MEINPNLKVFNLSKLSPGKRRERLILEMQKPHNERLWHSTILELMRREEEFPGTQEARTPAMNLPKREVRKAVKALDREVPVWEEAPVDPGFEASELKKLANRKQELISKKGPEALIQSLREIDGSFEEAIQNAKREVLQLVQEGKIPEFQAGAWIKKKVGAIRKEVNLHFKATVDALSAEGRIGMDLRVQAPRVVKNFEDSVHNFFVKNRSDYQVAQLKGEPSGTLRAAMEHSSEALRALKGGRYAEAVVHHKMSGVYSMGGVTPESPGIRALNSQLLNLEEIGARYAAKRDLNSELASGRGKAYRYTTKQPDLSRVVPYWEPDSVPPREFEPEFEEKVRLVTTRDKLKIPRKEQLKQVRAAINELEKSKLEGLPIGARAKKELRIYKAAEQSLVKQELERVLGGMRKKIDRTPLPAQLALFHYPLKNEVINAGMEGDSDSDFRSVRTRTSRWENRVTPPGEIVGGPKADFWQRRGPHLRFEESLERAPREVAERESLLKALLKGVKEEETAAKLGKRMGAAKRMENVETLKKLVAVEGGSFTQKLVRGEEALGKALLKKGGRWSKLLRLLFKL